ncbi:MAG: cysteine peptidase family C39 domain-containing protein, partial [Pseudomonadales bacterium]|nr:cysteine peptidase family C39 domain-containing protein [Pseudomonadales bacterium]
MSSKLRFFHRNNTPIILQSEAAECGLACLAMVAGYHGHHMDLRSLRARFSVSLKGVTVAQLIKVAGELGLNTRPLRLEPEHLSGLKLPVILHWDLNHFVVLVAASRKGMTIHDPGKGVRHYSLEEFSKHFTGVALELSPSQHFQKQEKQDPIKVQQLIGGVRGLGKTLGQIFLLAAVLEVFALAAPLFMQLVVDQAIVTQDHDLLTVLGIGFLLLMLAQVGVTTLRSWVVLYLSTHLNLHMVTNLFRHLLRLPVRFFQNRHLGDVVSRFESLNVIQRTLTNQFIEAVVDGIMVIATLIMIAIYST